MISIGDIATLIEYKFFRAPDNKRAYISADDERCWQLLQHTSRSFVAVIEELNPELREPMMIFYLVLRGLDTIEDDTGLDPAVKLPLLREFKQRVLTRKDWTFNDSSPTEKDRILLQEFDVVLRLYHDLKPAYQDVIADITDKMGNGMADYAAEDAAGYFDGLETIADYDLYCHHVAGIVGEGITRMAEIAKYISGPAVSDPSLYESMGLFLQKTNIIRDYREDMDEGRSFWPKEVWQKYATHLSDFTEPKNRQNGLHCISELMLLSLAHVTDCLQYLSNVEEPSLFRFCAIPQVMSIASLELVFNNPKVFETNVKIKKPLAVRLILDSGSMHNVYQIFHHFVIQIHQKNVPTDPNFFKIELMCARIVQYINEHDAEGQAAISRYSAIHDKRRSLLGFSVSEEDFEMYSGIAMGITLFGSVLLLMFGTAVYFGARLPQYDN